MDINTVTQQIEEFKQTRLRNSITPESLGNLLENIISAIRNETQTIVLEINVGESKTEFVNKDEWAQVWSAMQKNVFVLFIIAVSYTSGSRHFLYPTCVKTNYISLNAKAGSCELHVNENGTFTISGTSLW